jgi:DnaK suppressor protein
MKHHHEHLGREVRAALLARAAELRTRLARVRDDLRREREPLPRDSADAAIALENDEVLQALEHSAERELRLIDTALERIEHGVYGLCTKCSVEIDSGRLRAVPYANHCRACAEA